ncbi:universal stress protein [Egicoccus sp. AB-alg2]|uniref:universal stress protein n=1 Tax=Egicoccus sp. AB-alg2 TaxID=3242693 RepID=UPI00359D403A
MSIVVCTPGGPAQDALVEAGQEQARQAGRDLVLVRHVKLPGFEHDVDQEMTAAADVRTQLEATATTVSERGVSCRALVVTSGDDNPSTALLEAVADAEASLLVIGIRARSRVGKLLLGSTTQDLLLAAGRPVLCVPVEARH